MIDTTTPVTGDITGFFNLTGLAYLLVMAAMAYFLFALVKMMHDDAKSASEYHVQRRKYKLAFLKKAAEYKIALIDNVAAEEKLTLVEINDGTDEGNVAKKLREQVIKEISCPTR